MEKSGLTLPKSSPAEPQNRQGKSWKVSKGLYSWNDRAKCWKEHVSFCTSLGNVIFVNKVLDDLGAL